MRADFHPDRSINILLEAPVYDGTRLRWMPEFITVGTVIRRLSARQFITHARTF
ncbi:hypothetical protein MMEU_3835 [Mycobacterium marinum str. Europe]|nr:hypothetical protein MMEU_3835 [Mycobacterium marinum str. Europe]